MGKRVPIEERVRIANAVIEGVAARTDGLRLLCSEHGVTVGQFLAWVDASPQLQEQYARAKRIQAESIAAEIVAISDEADVQVVHEGEATRLELSANAIQRNRLRIDARKWVAAKLLPKVYGDKLAVGGAEDLGPVVIVTGINRSSDDAAGA
jgi:hypothetical protein